MNLLYVVSRWGEPTETFVRREIAAAVDAGHAVQVVSLKAPLATTHGPDVVHLGTTAAVARAIGAAILHPDRALRVLRLLRGSSVRNLPRHAYALAVALAVDSRLRPPGWIHAHFAWLSATTAWGIAVRRGVPFGIMPHAHDIYEHALGDGLLRRKLGAAALVVVESERIRADVARSLQCDATVLRMGVPDSYVVERADDAAAGRRVLSVGALRPKKGHDVLVRAVASLPGVELDIIGEGPERTSLTDAIASLRATDRIRLLGHVSEADVATALDGTDVFALASRVTPEGDRDGVPNVLIEAMARGVPVVSTDVAGIPDLLADSRGTVVRSGDVTAFSEAIEELLSDPELRNHRRKVAQDHVREHYTVTANWRRFERLISEARAG